MLQRLVTSRAEAHDRDDARTRGPSGRPRGGILAAYFDNTVGVEAGVLGETSRMLFIQGECRRPDGTAVALGRTKLIAADEQAPGDA